MATPTAQEAARRWAANLKNAKKSIEAGVMAVSVSPTELAAQKVDKYAAGVQAAVDSGRYQQGLRNVTLAQWQQAFLTKGIQRLDSGVSAAEPKMQSFLTEFLPFASSVSQAVRAMPDTTESERDQRMLEAVRMMRGFKRRGKSY